MIFQKKLEQLTYFVISVYMTVKFDHVLYTSWRLFSDESFCVISY